MLHTPRAEQRLSDHERREETAGERLHEDVQCSVEEGGESGEVGVDVREDGGGEEVGEGAEGGEREEAEHEDRDEDDVDEDVGVVRVVGAVEGELGFEVEERHGCSGAGAGDARRDEVRRARGSEVGLKVGYDAEV